MTITTKGLLPRLCPYSVYEYPCEKQDCQDCQIRIEATARENAEIAENMRSYWTCLRSLADK